MKFSSTVIVLFCIVFLIIISCSKKSPFDNDEKNKTGFVIENSEENDEVIYEEEEEEDEKEEEGEKEEDGEEEEELVDENQFHSDSEEYDDGDNKDNDDDYSYDEQDEEHYDIDEQNIDEQDTDEEITDEDTATGCPEGFGGKKCDECVRFADAQKPESGSSLSWNTATSSIQKAINSAQTYLNNNGGKCSVFIKKGIYPISKTIFMMDNISVIGGFDGKHTEVELSDPQKHPVILDGDHKVERILVGSSDATLKNLTIKNGSASESNISDGGGMLVFFAYGLKIEHIVFTGNKAKNGGALHIGDYSDVTVTDSIFSDNLGLSQGGAIKISEESRVTIDRCIFKENLADKGGAVSVDGCGSESVYIFNSLFVENMGFNNGGAIYVTGSSPFFAFNTLTGNDALKGSAIYSENGNEPYLCGNIFSFNSSSDHLLGNFFTVYNNFYPSGYSYSGTGNIYTDPMFQDSENGNYRLHPHSPSINSVPLELDFIKYDLDGKKRPRNGSFDMGCFEY